MKLISTRIVTKDVPSLAKFYEEILQITRVGTDDFVELRTSGPFLPSVASAEWCSSTLVPRLLPLTVQ